MSMSAGARRSGVCADINVTPFADIMIVLLIIFMVAASVVGKDDRFRLPPAANAREALKAPLVVKVTREGRLLLGETAMVDAAMLEMVLRARLAGGDPGTVQLQADEGLPYDRVAPSLAALRAAGAVEIVLRTQPGVRTSRNP
jgi:biopolymer transport protein ExbD